MNDSTAPWRALEDGPGTSPARIETGSEQRSSTSGRGPLAWWIAGALALSAVLIVVAIWLVTTGGQGSVAIEGGGSVAATAPESSSGVERIDGGDMLVIDVQGAVRRPGIVRLSAGARVADAIRAAGGYGSRVAAERVGQVLNLAALVRDGDQVVVPSRDESRATAGATVPGGAGGGGSGGGPVDLNRATAGELDALPGIGPVTAAKIIAARDEQPFTSLDELRSRKVLGPATLEKIKNLVVVR